MSFEPEFGRAYREEIQDGQLSDYATTSEQEGFAEFCRLLYGSDADHSAIEEAFPKTFSFFKSQGLI